MHAHLLTLALALAPLAAHPDPAPRASSRQNTRMRSRQGGRIASRSSMRRKTTP